jgi:hypothetical protein
MKHPIKINSQGCIYNRHSLFGQAGQLNAANIRQALQALVKYAAILEENSPPNKADK